MIESSATRRSVQSIKTTRKNGSAPVRMRRAKRTRNFTDLEDNGLWLYRERTVGLLKRYFRLSIEVGRLPSLLGREFFRTRVTSYRVATFEDVVIFVHDMERSLEKLGEFERKLIAKIVFHEFSHEEAARVLGCWRRTLERRFANALDRLSAIFLSGGLLVPFPGHCDEVRAEQCQEPKTLQTDVSKSNYN